MAKECKCCGRKGGLVGLYMLTKEEGICAKCHSVFSVQINRLEASTSMEEIDELYNEIVEAVNKADYSEEGRKFVLTYVEQRRNVRNQRAEATVQRAQEIQQEKEQEIARKEKYQDDIKKCKLTTGYNFEGYRIVDYIKVIDGVTVLGTGFLSEWNAQLNDMFGSTATLFEEKISKAKELAEQRLICNAVENNANAVIGVDFDITTFQNNIIMVAANGTAVVIEKE